MHTETVSPNEEIFQIPLSDIQLSKTNPRRERDSQALDDLANDIKKRGVQEPILIRPITSSDAKFELVFGERRYLASQKAGVTTIRAMKRELSDEEAEDLQIMENLQREDLSFLDEAAAFKRLYERRFKQTQLHDDAVGFVVATVNKKPEYVIQRLKLNDLIPDAQTAVHQRKLLLGHALEMARLRTEEQETALKWLLRQSKEIRNPDGWKKVHIIPGVPEFRLWVRQNLFLDLKNAPFDTNDATLSPSMGACTDCQLRTGNQPALFGDIKKGDLCTAVPCWLAKRDAAIVKMTSLLANELGVKSVLKVGIGHTTWNDSKVPVDTYIEYGSEARIVKPGSECQHTKPGVITWIAHHDRDATLKFGDSVLVCTKAIECSTHKKIDSRSERARKSFEQMAETRIANLRKDLPQRVRAALIRGVIESVLKSSRASSRADKVKFELAAAQMHADLFFDRHRDLCKLMAVEPIADRNGGKDWRGTTRKMFQGKPVGLMVAMVLMHRYHLGFASDGDPLKPLIRVYRLNAKAIERRVNQDTSAKIASIQSTLKKRKRSAG